MSFGLPPYAVVFGPDANCTLSTCDVAYSVYGYRPSLPGNIIFLALFALSMIIHAYLGFRWRQWFFAVMMMIGSLIEIIGYVGRIMLYNNPFSFIGFMLQIVLITCGPVFYTAAIYVTLSKSIRALAPELARFRPEIFYWVFIPADVICLVLQAAGGALSTISSGSSQTGVDVALAGLILQVVVLAFFSVALSDYLIRYFRSGATTAFNRRTRIYFSFLGLAIILILGRCIYRAYELSKGYQNSNLIRDQGLFIGLEGVLVLVAVYALCIGHPGLILSTKSANSVINTTGKPGAMTEAKGKTVSSESV